MINYFSRLMEAILASVLSAVCLCRLMTTNGEYFHAAANSSATAVIMPIK
jgi:hypothetical protein